MKAVQVRIEGVVQGVWYRAWTEKTALALGLHGWVRNRTDGSVEAVFKGAADAVHRMLDACHDGPPHARVSAVTVIDDAVDEVADGFAQLKTA